MNTQSNEEKQSETDAMNGGTEISMRQTDPSYVSQLEEKASQLEEKASLLTLNQNRLEQ